MRKLFKVVLLATSFALAGCGDEVIKLPDVNVTGATSSFSKEDATLRYIDADTLACVGCGGNPEYSYVLDADTNDINLIVQDPNLAAINFKNNPGSVVIMFKRTAPVKFLTLDIPANYFASRITEEKNTVKLYVTDGNETKIMQFNIKYN